jgi:lipopolysaccharide/colanic/teichoic acid biosynthesis glycosyltransferase
MLFTTDPPGERNGHGGRSAAGPAHAGPPRWYLACRAVADFVGGLVLLLLALPFLAAAAALVKLTSRGPALYSQTRLGKNGRPYTLYKLRTMVHNCEQLTGPRWATPHDPRVTPVGHFLRRTHIDELPQLWNVLRGEMSLIGPRPERPEFVPQLERAIPRYRDRLQVRPGITGLAQVQLPADTDLGSVRRKLAYDLYYLRHQGPWLDFQVLVCTACKLLGIPFAVPQRLLGVPSRDAVEPPGSSGTPVVNGTHVVNGVNGVNGAAKAEARGKPARNEVV